MGQAVLQRQLPCRREHGLFIIGHCPRQATRAPRQWMFTFCTAIRLAMLWKASGRGTSAALRVGGLPLHHRPSDRAVFERGGPPVGGFCAPSPQAAPCIRVRRLGATTRSHSQCISHSLNYNPNTHCVRSDDRKSRLGAGARLGRELERFVRLATRTAHCHGLLGLASIAWLHSRLIQCMPVLEGTPCLQW